MLPHLWWRWFNQHRYGSCGVVVSFLAPNKITEIISLYKKSVFCLSVLEGPVYDQLVPLPLGLWQGSPWWWEHVAEQTLITAKKQKREWGRSCGPTVSFKNYPQWPHSLLLPNTTSLAIFLSFYLMSLFFVHYEHWIVFVHYVPMGASPG